MTVFHTNGSMGMRSQATAYYVFPDRVDAAACREGAKDGRFPHCGSVGDEEHSELAPRPMVAFGCQRAPGLTRPTTDSVRQFELYTSLSIRQ